MTIEDLTLSKYLLKKNNSFTFYLNFSRIKMFLDFMNMNVIYISLSAVSF